MGGVWYDCIVQSLFPGGVMQYIGIIIFFVLYFLLAPMVNDDTCRALAESSSGSLNRIVGQLLVLCWVPWN